MLSETKKQIIAKLAEQAAGLYRRTTKQESFKQLADVNRLDAFHEDNRRNPWQRYSYKQSSDVYMCLIRLASNRDRATEWRMIANHAMGLLAQKWSEQGYVSYGRAKEALLARISDELAMLALEE
jgi:hypothetical protein